MSKKKIIVLILCIMLGSYVTWELLHLTNPLIEDYKYRYEQMSKPEYLQALRDFCTNELHDSIENLNYSELVAWEHKYLRYTPNQFTRRELPIDILQLYITDGIAFGRCGEFALCYNGLCLANGYKTRLVLDESKATGNKLAGDHLWVEIEINGTWTHVDPTESRFNDPKMYVKDWNKEINNVVAITKDDSGKIITLDVTKNYA